MPNGEEYFADIAAEKLRKLKKTKDRLAAKTVLPPSPTGVQYMPPMGAPANIPSTPTFEQIEQSFAQLPEWLQRPPIKMSDVPKKLFYTPLHIEKILPEFMLPMEYRARKSLAKARPEEAKLAEQKRLQENLKKSMFEGELAEFTEAVWMSPLMQPARAGMTTVKLAQALREMPKDVAFSYKGVPVAVGRIAAKLKPFYKTLSESEIAQNINTALREVVEEAKLAPEAGFARIPGKGEIQPQMGEPLPSFSIPTVGPAINARRERFSDLLIRLGELEDRPSLMGDEILRAYERGTISNREASKLLNEIGLPEEIAYWQGKMKPSVAYKRELPILDTEIDRMIQEFATGKRGAIEGVPKGKVPKPTKAPAPVGEVQAARETWLKTKNGKRYTYIQDEYGADPMFQPSKIRDEYTKLREERLEQGMSPKEKVEWRKSQAEAEAEDIAALDAGDVEELVEPAAQAGIDLKGKVIGSGQDAISIRKLQNGKYQVTPSYNQQTLGAKRQVFNTEAEAMQSVEARPPRVEGVTPSPWLAKAAIPKAGKMVTKTPEGLTAEEHIRRVYKPEKAEAARKSLSDMLSGAYDQVKMREGTLKDSIRALEYGGFDTSKYRLPVGKKLITREQYNQMVDDANVFFRALNNVEADIKPFPQRINDLHKQADSLESKISTGKTPNERATIARQVRDLRQEADALEAGKAIPEAGIKPPVKPPEVPPVVEAKLPVKPEVQEAIKAKPVDLPAAKPPPRSKPDYKPPPEGGVPTEPVLTPDNKIWLPEPPRITKPFIDFKRKEVGRSFKGKGVPDSALDTIEQAKQMVLKARDIGSNTMPYVMSYIRRAGDVMKEFGVTTEGLATKVANPQNRSLAINDILSNYTRYDLTPKQIEIAKKYGEVYNQALKLARSYGVKIEELGSTDELWQYIARRVKGKKNPATGEYEMPPPSIGGFKMGAKISAQKQRIFDEMLEGVDLGYLYENPAETLPNHIRGIYRLIGNKQAENLVKPLTRVVSKKAPLVYGERAIFEPALRGRAAKAELAQAIDDIYAIEKESKVLRAGAETSGALVGQVAALDISAPFIQGLPGLGHDIAMGLKGKPSFTWLQSYGNMWKTVWNPESINKFRIQNAEKYKRYIEYGMMTGQSEFVAGVSTVQRVLGKVPVAGKTLREGYRQTWGRMGQAYSDFLEVIRFKYIEQMEPIWERQGRNVYELGAVSNRMSGVVSAAARGVSRNRQLAERMGAFAPNYLRSSFLMMKDLISKGATAREVQASIAAMLGTWAAFYYCSSKMLGQKPKMKPWAKRFGGDGAEAYTYAIGDNRVGLGGFIYSAIKTLADVGAMAVDEPEKLIVFDKTHPFVKYAMYKRSPPISLIEELATGRNFWGKKLEDPGDYLMLMVEHTTPIFGQSLIERAKGYPVRMGLEFAGLRSFPYTLRSRWEDEGKLGEFNDIPANEAEWNKEKIDNPELMTRNEYRKKNKEVDGRLFVVGIVDAVFSKEAADTAVKLIRENKINPDDIPGIKKRKEYIKEYKKLTKGMTDEQIRKAGLRFKQSESVDYIIKQLEKQPVPQKTYPSYYSPSLIERLNRK